MNATSTMTLVLGGAASGKSAFAESIVAANQTGRQKLYIATAQAFDKEMQSKISLHKQSRANDGWITHEEPLNISDVFLQAESSDLILLDCATLWLTNQMMAEADLEQESDKLLTSIRNCVCPVVVVSNQVGQGIVPEHAMSRKFREAQGKLNQLLAADAHLVVQVIAGLPLVLKGELP